MLSYSPNPLKNSNYYTYRQDLNKKIWIFLKQCVYLFNLTLTIKNYYFPSLRIIHNLLFLKKNIYVLCEVFV
jgi:hypothetical protein